MNVRMRELSGVRAVGGSPTPEDLAIIGGGEYASGPVGPDDVHIREVYLCHNQHDYTYERFPKAYLDRFAETIPGKSVLPGHNTESLPVGRWFRGRLQQRVEKDFPLAPTFEPGEARVTWLRAGFYFPSDAGTELFRKNLDLGVTQWVSIGFRYDDLLCDVCGKSYLGSDCTHIIGRAADTDDDRIVMATYGGDPRKVQALEGSLVFLGAQQRARVTRAVSEGRVDPKALAMTPYGEDLVAMKGLEALARECGHGPRAWRVNMESETYTASEKGATRFADLPLADRGRAWDADAAEGRVRTWADAEDAPNERYRRAFFWFDADNAENFGAYKMPFADVIDGDLMAVPRGIFACAGVMRGGRGGVDIPEADRPAVMRHIARYYDAMSDEFGEEMHPPWESGSDAAPDGAHTDLPDGSERKSAADAAATGGNESNDAPHGAEGNDMDEIIALKARIDELEASLAKAESEHAAAVDACAGLQTALEAQQSLRAIGEKALADVRDAILADMTRLGEQTNPAVTEGLKSLADRWEYEMLVGIAADLRKRVLEKYPTSISGEPGLPESTGAVDVEYIQRQALQGAFI